MMASSAAVQGSGTVSAPWLLSVGNGMSGAVGLAKVLVMRLPPIKKKLQRPSMFIPYCHTGTVFTSVGCRNAV